MLPSALPYFNASDVAEIEYTAAPSQIVKAFNFQAKPLMDKVEHNARERVILTELRDSLLPKLISGELRVPDAEKVLAKSPL